MDTGTTIIVVTALLAAPAGVLVAVAAGAWGAWRVMNGLSPVPRVHLPFRRRPAPPANGDGKEDEASRRPPLPRVRA